MPYTITSNASVGVHASTHQTASDALAAALELGARGHRTVQITAAEGLPLTLAGLEDRAARETAGAA